MKRHITYQLRIRIARAKRITVGRLGRFLFPAGKYVYTGSAKRNLDARIRRHLLLGSQKRMHWHIDYLLADPAVQIVRVTRSSAEECRLNQRTRGVVVVPGFGSSDCRRCGSHLKRQ
jgi:Uri superfamily endonuclease